VYTTNFSSLLVSNILVPEISQNVNKLLALGQDEILLYTKLEGEDKFRVTSTTKLKEHKQDSISLRVARLEGKHCSSVNRVVITATERKPVSSLLGTSDDERTLQDSTLSRSAFFYHIRCHLAVMIIYQSFSE